MTTSLSWIKAYVPELEVEPQEYMDAMTLSGSKVEGYKKLDEDLEKIVIGSEGTLGIITELTLKLVPLPRATAHVLAVFPSPETALALVTALPKQVLRRRAWNSWTMTSFPSSRTGSKKNSPARPAAPI